ncbi:replication protein [Yersinia kristensenii]|uniref:replication protein n=1 Tax=Yersinia kristensenii TaxID=28152 RepID=UPI001C60B729|nr:replication protein [Yersinia kristensenii]MBW5826565.1 replication protein [Yersinia kristensenii]
MNSNLRRVDFINKKVIRDDSGGHVATLDEGYFRVASSIGKLKPKLKLAGREHQVFDAVIYCTFGWNKSEDKVTNTYIADMTELDDSDVADALKVLAERRIINLRKVGGFKIVSVNVNLEQWALNKQPKNTTKVPPEKLGETTHNNGQKKVSNWAKPPDTLNSLTKDNINTKTPLIPQGGKVKGFDPLSVEIPEWLSKQSWIEWVSYRSQSKKPIKSMLTVTKAFNLLKECFDEGHDPSAVIDASIANSYQGLFKPSYPVKRRSGGVSQPAKPMTTTPEGFRS